MTIHKWLGTTLAVLLVGLVLWRWWFFKSNSQPSVLYLLVSLVVVGAVVYQGHLGGEQSFSMFSVSAAPSSSSAMIRVTTRKKSRSQESGVIRLIPDS